MMKQKVLNDIKSLVYEIGKCADVRDFAKHFFELGLKAQKGE